MSQAGNFVPLEGIIGSNFGPALPESIGHPSSMTVTVEGAVPTDPCKFPEDTE